jgi:hypothetical protein
MIFNPTFTADASILRFPNLTSITGDPGSNQGTLFLQAFNGGTLDISALPQFTSSNRVIIRADGAGSLVDLSALTSFVGHAFFGSQMRPTANGEVRVNATGTTLSNVLLTGVGTVTGTINTSTVTGANSDVGQLNITGNFAQTATASTFADIGGTVAGTNYDRFAIGGTAALNGALSLDLFAAYSPAYLFGHTILTAASRTGHFSSISGMLLSPLKGLAVTYTASGVVVTATIPGDANVDGTVNSLDFSALAANFNKTNVGWVEGDFGGDGKANAIDFNSLASNYGKITASLGLAANSEVPSAPDAASLFSSSRIDLTNSDDVLS